MIRMAVDKGLDVNIRSQGGYTPLHVAAMHNKEAIMQFLVSEYHADINKRDFSGRKPRHYLQSSSSNYIKQMMFGQSTAEVIQPHTLASLAEPKQEEKRHSKIGSLLRSSFRHSFRLWGSAENLEDKDHKRDRTPPVTPPPSPKSRPKNSVNYSQSLLMPPPSGYTVPNRSRKLRSSSDKDRSETMRKSESDPDMIVETTPTTYV
ncbi:ankyrin repeat domain-containing protein SOWAHB-like isoform X2 [Lytechinus pictus]|uniref:ankyrin repeat domain-containing protein SOWAHB-like isoform X2 n=2 Tax=Lytechinus pictus TaxID=7653 RepID=UPI0030B9B0CC